MDATSERSVPFPLDEGVTCYLEEEETLGRFPRAETCVVGAVIGGFLVTVGVVMITLHYTVENRQGFHSVLEHMRVAAPVLGLSFVVLAGALLLCALFAYALWKVMQVVEMAHRYREHRELCAYEEMRQSFRSSQKGGLGRYDSRCVVDIRGSGRFSTK